VAKLLFIHLMGYPTEFGQMEAIRLVASSKFAEKRIGYLALMILLQENQEILMMVTNTMKKDLSREGDQDYVAGLALCALGSVASADMARELAKDVANFLTSSNKPFLRKKAALCALRFIRKVPDLIEEFLPGVHQLLQTRNNAVQVTALTLMIEMCRIAPEQCVPEFRQHVPRLLQILKSLWVNGDAEYDMMGIIDPFLQVRVLQLIRELGRDDVETSKMVTDVLAMILLNTDQREVPGCAVLYECCQTVFSIQAENGLRTLALNLLGRFLINKSSSIKYVALNALCQLVHRDHAAVNEHRAIIIELLRDNDVPVRRKALDLIFALVNKSNAKNLVKEMLNYFAIAPGEQQFKADLANKIYYLVDTYAPTCNWYIGTMIKVLAVTGSIAPDYIATDLLSLISRTEEQHRFAVYKLAETLADPTIVEQSSLSSLALWVIGEYGKYLINAADAEKASVNEFKATFSAYTPQAVIKLVGSLIESKKTTVATKQVALNTLAKLTAHFGLTSESAIQSPELITECKRLFSLNLKSMNPELQQRSSEYLHLLQYDSLRPKILASMPKFKRPGKFGTLDKRENMADEAQVPEKSTEASSPKASEASKPQSAMNTLEALFGASSSTAAAPAATATAKPAEVDAKQTTPPTSLADTLFGTGAATTTPTTAAAPNVFDMFLAPQTQAAPATTAMPILPGGMPMAPGGVAPMLGMPGMPGMPAMPGMPGMPGTGMPNLFSPPAAKPETSDITDMLARVAIAQPGAAAATASAASPASDPVVLNEKGLIIKLGFKYTSPKSVTVTAKYSNTNPTDITDLELSVSVPSHLKAHIKPASSRTIPAKSENSVTQDFMCEAAERPDKFIARIRVVCMINGEKFVQVSKVDCFPPVPAQ